MRVYRVVVNRDDTVQVASVAVVRETPQYYFIEDLRGLEWRDPRRNAFGYVSRLLKERSYTSQREALEAYMTRRQRDKQDALTLAGTATKQIASANELLMKLPVEQSA